MSEIPKTRNSLILRLQSDEDVAAWSEFVEIYEPLILQLARQKGLQAADAADVTQDVLSKIVTAINRYDLARTGGTFRGWIATIARNLVVDFLRNRSRKSDLSTGDSDIQRLIESTPDSSTETSEFDMQWQKRLFGWAVEKVKPEFRDTTWQAFWKNGVESKPAPDVAQELGISIGAVYIAKSRVIAKLRKAVNGTGFESAIFDSKGAVDGL